MFSKTLGWFFGLLSINLVEDPDEKWCLRGDLLENGGYGGYLQGKLSDFKGKCWNWGSYQNVPKVKLISPALVF